MNTHTCPECHTPLSREETRGLCAPCLFKLGLARTHSGGEGGPAPSTPEIFPFEFGAYRILRPLGRGGMGAVYEAEELGSGRRLAIKMLSSSLDSKESRARFLREGQLAASMNHPHSVYVYGTEEIEGTPVITMELLAGGTLQERVAKEGPMDPVKAVDVILQVISGLEAAHSMGILHRDIKPSNCFCELDGTVKVGDFGLSISTAPVGESATTWTASLLGTPAFSSPEQVRSDLLDVRSDIYSAGATLFYLLTGRPPFVGQTMSALLAAVLEKPAPGPRSLQDRIPKGLEKVVLRCLSKAADSRFRCYAELREALAPYASTTPAPATLGIRFAAGVLDHLVLSVPYVLLIPISIWAQSKAHLWHAEFWHALVFAYYASCEGVWGTTLGRSFFRLTVANGSGKRASFAACILRAAIFVVPCYLVFRSQSYVLCGSESYLASRENEHPIFAVLLFLVMASGYFYHAALFASARRRNGFATVLDLLTGTRLVRRAATDLPPSAPALEMPVALAGASRKLGPYDVLAQIGNHAEDGFFLGYDPKLKRRVWLRIVQGEPLSEAALGKEGGVLGLRWIQRLSREERFWDVFEAPVGGPLLRVATQPQPWKTVRNWLLDLCEGLEAATGKHHGKLSLNRIWICENGRVKWLPFAAPGTDPHLAEFPVTEIAPFIHQVAVTALDGRPAPAPLASTECPKVPLPLPARDFFSTLSRTKDLKESRELLRSLVEQPAAVSGMWRFCLMLGALLYPLAAWVCGAMAPLASNPPKLEFSLQSLRFYPSLLAVAVLSLAAALLTRGGLLMRSLGVAVVERDGSDASRGRVFCRTFVAWAWLAPFTALELLHPASALAVLGLFTVALLPVAVWRIVSGRRSIQDVVAQTFLVPR